MANLAGFGRGVESLTSSRKRSLTRRERSSLTRSTLRSDEPEDTDSEAFAWCWISRDRSMFCPDKKEGLCAHRVEGGAPHSPRTKGTVPAQLWRSFRKDPDR